MKHRTPSKENRRGVVVIPTYNEAANITPLVHLILGQDLSLDILIADDNSPDGTGQIAARLAAVHAVNGGQVHVLHRPHKEGLGRAYLAGFAWAMRRGYDFVIQMDADLSHDPISLAALITASEEADVVLGSRYLHGISVVNWPLRRILLSWGANQYVRLVTGLTIRDGTSGYRFYRCEALAAMDLGSVLSNGYSFQVEMTFRAALAGCRLAEVPIVFTERRSGCSKMFGGVIWESLLVPLRLRLGAAALRRRLGPLRGEAGEPIPLSKAA